ncbi:MAG: thioredoxin family protein [Planctomycetota bacterium]
MSNTLRLALVVLVPVMLLAALAYAAEEKETEQKIPWQTDIEAALANGEESGTPSLLYFTADWCPPCKQMKKTTWVDDSVVAALEDYTPVYIDADSQPQVLQSYGVSAIPTIVLVDPAGEELFRTVGYVEAKALVATLDKHAGE